MIKKIVSNGRTDVARGALDAAIALDIPHGGWTSGDGAHGGKPLPDKYHLQKTKSKNSVRCVERNVKDSDGTLILTFTDEMSQDSSAARKSSERLKKPWLLINVNRTGTFQAAQTIHEWLKEHGIRVVHVVGSTNETSPKKADALTSSLLEAAFYLGLIERNMTATSLPPGIGETPPPASIDGIVRQLSDEMTLKDKVIVANMQEAQLELLQPTLGRHILVRLEKWQDSPGPRFSLKDLDKGITDVDDLSHLIIKELWQKLRTTHRMRLVK